MIFSISLAPWHTARLSEKTWPLVVLLPALLVWMLTFEVAASVWKVQFDYLLATNTGEYLLEGMRWLPLAACFLWAREQIVLRRAEVNPPKSAPAQGKSLL